MATLGATARRINDWYHRGFRSLVVNGEKRYMKPYREALKAAGIEYHPTWYGKKPYRFYTIWVKREELQEAGNLTRNFPCDWYAAMKRKERGERND